MPIALIAAVAGKKMVIGRDGDLPWHFPSDLKFFKEKTAGHAVLMGRVTYGSILKRLAKPLPNRRNIVLTRDQKFQDERVTVVHDLNAALELVSKEEWLFVIGGAQVYQQALPHADWLYLTHIEQEIAGDAFFPDLWREEWLQMEESIIHENDTVLRFCSYLHVHA